MGGVNALSALCCQHVFDHVTTQTPQSFFSLFCFLRVFNSLCSRHGGVPKGCLDDRCSSLEQLVFLLILWSRILQFYFENPNRKSGFCSAAKSTCGGFFCALSSTIFCRIGGVLVFRSAPLPAAVPDPPPSPLTLLLCQFGYLKPSVIKTRGSPGSVCPERAPASVTPFLQTLLTSKWLRASARRASDRRRLWVKCCC